MPMPMSPCVGVCQLDDRSGLCRGCSRTRDEVARWSTATAAEQMSIWEALNRRRAADPSLHMMLPWDRDARQVAVEASLGLSFQSWAISTWGAVAEFHRADNEPFNLVKTANGFEGSTPRGAIRIQALEKARGFLGNDKSTVAFAIHKARVDRHPATTITALGPDQQAIRVEDKAAELFDLGLGLPHMKFCVRTSDTSLIETLLAKTDSALFDRGNRQTLDALREASPHRVVTSILGRVEVYQSIAGHGGVTPEGPHTHLLPDLLSENKRFGPDLVLPPTYFPALYLYRSGPPANA